MFKTNITYLKFAQLKMEVTQKTAKTVGPLQLANEQAGCADQMHLDQTTKFWNYPLHDKIHQNFRNNTPQTTNSFHKFKSQ